MMGGRKLSGKGRDMVISWENLHYVGTRGQSFFKLQTSRQDRTVKKFPLGTNDIYLTNEGTVFRHRPSKRPDSLNIIQDAISTKDPSQTGFTWLMAISISFRYIRVFDRPGSPPLFLDLFELGGGSITFHFIPQDKK